MKVRLDVSVDQFARQKEVTSKISLI